MNYILYNEVNKFYILKLLHFKLINKVYIIIKTDRIELYRLVLC